VGLERGVAEGDTDARYDGDATVRERLNRRAVLGVTGSERKQDDRARCRCHSNSVTSERTSWSRPLARACLYAAR